MYLQIIVPTEKDHTIALPEYLFGKQVEVVVNEVIKKTTSPSLPTDLKDKKFWDDIVFDTSFPSLTEPTRSATDLAYPI